MTAGVADQLAALLPALAFLLAGVPLAALLDTLGFFDAVASRFATRPTDLPVVLLWVLAAGTTIVLNLDTTVVLLTPLYLRLARRADVDPLPLAIIPLLLASLASSVLPVSNLTTLILVGRLHVSVAAVITHLGAPDLAACALGWILYRRRHPTTLALSPAGPVDRRALRIGGTVTAGILIGFTLGPSYGVAPWVVALAADVVLAVVVRELPWRRVPLGTAAAVAALAALMAVVVPAGALTGTLGRDGFGTVIGLTAAGAVTANATNNLPAILIGLDATTTMTWGMWAWLLGVNTGAVLLPVGALANLLWLRVLRAGDSNVSTRRYASLTVPIALPALGLAALVLAAESLGGV
jgi:arsenical pump membrane protein